MAGIGAPKGHPKWGGRQKGSRDKKTLEREKVLKLYENQILKRIKPLSEAQLLLAEGITVMFAKALEKNRKGEYKRTGKFELIRDKRIIAELLNSKEEYYYITTEKPDTKMNDILMNRVFGKPKEQVELSGKTGEPIEISIVNTIKKVYGDRGNPKDDTDGL